MHDSSFTTLNDILEMVNVTLNSILSILDFAFTRTVHPVPYMLGLLTIS